MVVFFSTTSAVDRIARLFAATPSASLLTLVGCPGAAGAGAHSPHESPS